MLSLLETRDATTKAVIGFVAQFAASNPAEIIDQLFSYLDSTEKMKRRNALDILTEVFTITQKAPEKILG